MNFVKHPSPHPSMITVKADLPQTKSNGSWAIACLIIDLTQRMLGIYTSKYLCTNKNEDIMIMQLT